MKIDTPLTDALIEKLHAGDRLTIRGTVYTARDAAHKRLVRALENDEPLPFDPTGQVIYYMGPSPARPGRPIGSAGPTTACRMDPYTPPLLRAGLKGMIGKGARSVAVREALQRHRAVYFAAIGGAAALIADRIAKAQLVAYEDLGAEAIRRLWVEEFPVLVVNDIYGEDMYQLGQQKYRMTTAGSE